MGFFLSLNGINYKFQKPKEKEIKIRHIKSRLILKGGQYKNLKKSYFLPRIFTVNSNVGYHHVGFKDANTHLENFFVLQGCSKNNYSTKEIMGEQKRDLSSH